MQFGNLEFEPVEEHLELVAAPVRQAILEQHLSGILVAEIDPTLADTAAFCEKYWIGLDVSANCVIVQAKRSDSVWYAACMIQATERADVNNAVRRQLDARKISFAPMDSAVKLTGMEYGGINPIGLPSDWPVLVDESVTALDYAVIGSGLRKSKLLVPGSLLAALPGTMTLDIKRQPS